VGGRVTRLDCLEGITALLIPPACREEVLGDLRERNTAPRPYALDAIRAVPLVIVSRIRRTTDPQLLLMHAFVLYLSFYVTCWFKDRALLYEPWALARLAIPGAVALLALVLENAYARPGHRSPLRLVRGPLLGVAWMLLFQAMLVFQAALSTGHSPLTLPWWILLYGGAFGLLLTSALRMLFSPQWPSTQGKI
jgi:hypothetical protein